MAHHYLVQTWGSTPAGDLTERVGNALLATLFPNGTGGCDSTAGDSAIDDAEADADSILGPSYDVPVDTTATGRIVKRCVADLTIFYGYERSPEFRRQGGENLEQARYDRAIKTLKDLKKGERDMGNETASNRKSKLTGGVVYASNTSFIIEPDEGTLGPNGGF